MENRMEKEIPEFLLEMSRQINTQDNRITSDPIFMVCCDRPYITAEGYERYVEYTHDDGDHSVLFSTKEGSKLGIEHAQTWLLENEPELVKQWEEENDCELSNMDFAHEYEMGEFDSIENLDKVFVAESMEVIKACLTEVDAQAFIKRKQHDYPKLYIYVQSMYFCPQMMELRNWIMSLTASGAEE